SGPPSAIAPSDKPERVTGGGPSSWHSLPCDPSGNPWQPVATVSPQIKPFSRYQRAERLPPVAPPLFHNCSIPRGPKTRALAGNNRRWRSATRTLAIWTSSKHGRHGRNWQSRYTAAWLARLGVYRLS